MRHVVGSQLEGLPNRYLSRILKAGIAEDEAKRNENVILHILHIAYGVHFQILHGDLLGFDTAAGTPKSGRPIPKMDVRKENPYQKFANQFEKKFEDSGVVVTHHVSGSKVAIKRIPYRPDSERQQCTLLAEAYYLGLCASASSNIVQFFGLYDYESAFHFVMEYVEGCTLHDIFFSCNEERFVVYLIHSLLNGLSAIHGLNLVHRDVKPENVFLSVWGDVKIGDFGLCCDVSRGMDNHFHGSSFWLAPEIICLGQSDQAADIWSLGICIAEILNLCPFSDRIPELKMMFLTAVYGRPHIRQDVGWSMELVSFTEYCLTKNPKARPTSLDLLQHKLFTFRSNNLLDAEISLLFGHFVKMSMECHSRENSSRNTVDSDEGEGT